jgi:hypothetical protein
VKLQNLSLALSVLPIAASTDIALGRGGGAGVGGRGSGGRGGIAGPRYDRECLFSKADITHKSALNPTMGHDIDPARDLREVKYRTVLAGRREPRYPPVISAISPQHGSGHEGAAFAWGLTR